MILKTLAKEQSMKKCHYKIDLYVLLAKNRL